MGNPSLLPTTIAPVEGRYDREFFPISVSIDQGTLDWLDSVASATKRSRSDTLREILRAVREQTSEPKDATPEPAASPS